MVALEGESSGYGRTGERHAVTQVRSVRVVAFSSDRYSDAWKPFAKLLERFWPDRPWPLVIVTNEVGAEIPGLHVITTGTDIGWGEAAARALESVPEEIVLVLMEDYFALAPWDTPFLIRALEAFSDDRVQYLRLSPVPPPSRPMDGLPWGPHDPGSPYRFSLQASLVRRNYLTERARKRKTPWEFELCETGDPERVHLSVVSGISPCPYTIAIRRGHIWQNEALLHCASLGIVCPDPIFQQK